MDDRSRASQPAAADDLAARQELRRGYHDRIAELREHSLAVVGGAVAIVASVRASLSADPSAEPGLDGRGADGIQGEAERWQALAAVVDSEVVDLLARESPVARDLRVILASRDVTQLALLCVGLGAGLHDRVQPASAALSPGLYERLGRLAAGTEQLLRRAEAAWAVLDVGLAAEVCAEVVAVRAAQTEFIAGLIGLDRVAMDAALALAMMSRAFERLADHAVEIAERVEFAVQGTPSPLIRP